MSNFYENMDDVEVLEDALQRLTTSSLTIYFADRASFETETGTKLVPGDNAADARWRHWNGERQQVLARRLRAIINRIKEDGTWP